MKGERMTRDNVQKSFGAMNPVGNIVLAFDDDKTAAEARTALLESGSFSDADILAFTSRDVAPRLNEMLHETSGAAGFGYESTLMRRYLALAQEGVGWLGVYAPEDEAAEKVAEVAKRFHAKSAVRYHTLASEDLV